MSNTQTIAVTGANTTYLNKQFYDRKLLETAKTKFVHVKYGQQRTIPPHSGARVEFRRWNLFNPDDAAAGLTEGVTPNGQNLSQSKVEATVKQYGAYVEVSDALDLTGYDEVLSDSAQLLGEQIGTVVERVTRDAMCAGTTVQYAGGQASRAAITSSDKLTVNEVRKAVRLLKKNNARPFQCSEDGQVRKPHFVCICSPETVYDLQSDSLWQDVSKYSNAEQIYTGEIGRLFGVVFVESPEAKVYTQSVLNAVKTAVTSGSSFVLKNTPTAAEVAFLSKGGNKIKIGSTQYTLSSLVPYDPATKTVTVTTTFSAQAGLSANDVVFSEDCGAVDASTHKGLDVHATLVFGQDAYGTVDVGGKGNVEIIVKPHGSAGSADPLNQRATVGAKVAAYAAVILNQDWIVRIEHAASAAQ